MPNVTWEDDFLEWPLNKNEISKSGRPREIEPEKQLLVAILERAALDATSPYDWSQMEKDLSGEAKGWFGLGARFREHSADHAFSFEWVCSYLDLDASALREKVRQCVREGKRLNLVCFYATAKEEDSENGRKDGEQQ